MTPSSDAPHVFEAPEIEDDLGFDPHDPSTDTWVGPALRAPESRGASGVRASASRASSAEAR